MKGKELVLVIFFFFRSPNLISQEYMKYLIQIAYRLGIQFYRYKISSLEKLFKEWNDADIFINCLGVEAFRVFNDNQVFPIRGVLIHLKEKVSLKKFISWDDHPDGLTYIISRRDKCILGGTTDKGNWDTTTTKEEVEKIYKRCISLAPELKDAEVIGKWVGLRPGRKTLRLELDLSYEKPVIHNVGHGGSGMTIHWGTADEVVKILQEKFPNYSIKPKL